MSAKSGTRRGQIAWLIAPWLGIAVMLALWPRGHRRGGAMADDRRLSPKAFETAEPGRGRMARHPGQIPPSGWRDILWRTWLQTFRDRLQLVAAGVTFFSLLALFPGLGAFVALYGIFSDVSAVREQLQQLALFLPRGALELVGTEMMRLATTHTADLSTAFLVSLLASIWSANAAMKAVFDGLNVAYEEAEKRGIIKRNLITLGFTFCAVIFMVIVSGAIVWAPLAFKWVGLRGVDLWWLPLLWVLIFVLSVIVFSILYRYGPSRQHAQWKWITWGSVFAAVAWLGGSAGFSAYVSNFGSYDRTYGSLGAFVAFMVWTWFSIFVVLLGAELNAEIEHQTTVDTTTGPPEPLGKRGAVVADSVGLAATKRNQLKIRRRPAHLWGALRDHMGWTPRRTRLPGSPDGPPDPRQSGGR